MGNSNYPYQALQPSDSNNIKNTNSSLLQYGQISSETPPMTTPIYSIHPQNSPTIQYGQISSANPPMANTFYSIHPQNSPNIQYGQMSVETPPITSAPYPIQLQNSPNALFCRTNMTNSNSSSFCRCITARAEVLNTQTHLPSGSGHQVSGSLEGASNSESEKYTPEDLQKLFNSLYRQQSFCKECIFKIHNIIVQILKDEGVKTKMKKVTRDEHRSKELYLSQNCKYYLIIKKYATKDIAEKARQLVYEEKKQKELKKQQGKM